MYKRIIGLLATTLLISTANAHPHTDWCIPLDRWIEIEQPCFKQDDVKKEDYVIGNYDIDNEEHQHLINYAYRLGGIEFVKTLDAEWWEWDAGKIGYNGDGSTDNGLCQLNSRYHSPFIESDDFKNPYIQLRYCMDVWNKAWRSNRIRTTFYGYNSRYERGHNLYYLN